ncbi:unnamed protein product, partial [marine sediment metagenome]
MTINYWGACVDPAGDDYTVAGEAMTCRLTRKVNSSSTFYLEVDNKDAAKIDTYTNGDKIDFHVGIEPLYQWGSLSALSFTTNDDISVNHHASLDFGSATDFTVAFRFKVAAFGSGTYELVSKSDGSAPDWRIRMDSDGALDAELDDGVNSVTVTSASGLDDNKWRTAIVTLDRDGNGQWYIGNVASGDATAISTVGDIDDGQKLYIGSLNHATNFATAKLDEICVWSEVISSDDRAAYESGSPDTTNLQAYWDFDEGYGSTATDEST